MSRSKLIPILLFLLLLLIILCTWCHSDDIAKGRENRLKSNGVTTISSEIKKTSIDYYLKKDDHGYQLTGNFSTKEELEKIEDALGTNSVDDITNLNKALKGNPEAITLTEKIIPLFTTSYVDGSIQYHNNQLIVEGTVNSNNDKDAINTLLANSTLATVNNTKVVTIPSKPIHFKISKANDALSLEGLFQSQTEVGTLTSRIGNTALQSTIDIDEKLIAGDNAIHVSTILVEALNQYYTDGFIAYDGEKLTVEGTVQSKEAEANMEKLLQASKLSYTNNTNIVLPTPTQEELDAAKLLQEQADAKKTEEEKALKLAQEKADAEKLAQEQAQLAKVAQEKAAQEALDIEAEIKKIIDIENINFAVNKAQLTPKSIATINHIATVLQKHTTINVEIGGHTDSDGDEKYNQTLSQKRVDTVKQKLIDLGISANRLSAIGYGESKPLVSNDTKENKRRNRRVEFKVKGE